LPVFYIAYDYRVAAFKKCWVLLDEPVGDFVCHDLCVAFVRTLVHPTVGDEVMVFQVKAKLRAFPSAAPPAVLSKMHQTGASAARSISLSTIEVRALWS